jgi:trigger factor
MKVNVTEKSPIERVLEVSVPQEQVEKAYEAAFRSALRHLSLPGFRKGKVPVAMGRRHITDASLTGQVLEDLLPSAFSQALEETGIRPLSEPHWDIIEKARDKDLVFHATFEVLPHVEIQDYKGLEITQERPEIGEEQVASVLERMRQGQSELLTLEEERGLQEGDVALVDFHSSENGEPLPRGNAENYPMELIPGSYVQGFLENLYGMKPGEERDFEIDFPADYPSELAGKHVAFHFNLKEIKVRRLPEMDDAFAQTVSDKSTIEELRAEILERMSSQVQHEAEHGVANQVFQKLLEQIQPEVVPPSLVLSHARQYSASVARDLERRGQTLSEMLRQQGRSEEDWSKHAMGIGFGEACMEILIDSLARQEGIQATEEDLDPHIEQEATRTRQSEAAVRRRMREEGTLELLKSHIVRHKVMHAVVDATKVDYVVPQPQGQEQEAPAPVAAEV